MASWMDGMMARWTEGWMDVVDNDHAHLIK